MRFKGYISLICLLALNSLLSAAFAQAIVNPLPGNDQACQSAQQSTTVNCDMVALSHSEKLFAIAWDDNGQAYVRVFLQSETAENQLISLPTGSTEPDIAIAHNPSVSGDLKIAVTYQLGTDVYLGVYSVSGITSGTLATTLSGTYKLNTQAAGNAHVDMLADNSNKIDGKPSLHKFGVTWSEFDPTVSAVSVQARVADIADPTAYLWTAYVPQAINPDVACYVDANTNKEFLCVLYTKPNSVNGTGSDLRLLETEINGSLNQYHFLEKGKDIAPGRIECQPVYTGTASKWAVVAAIGTGTPGMYATMMYNDNKTGADLSSLLGNYNNGKPAIAAGQGKDNVQYAASFFPMYQSSLYFTSASQWTGNWTSNYYRANKIDMNITAGQPAVAVSAVSNTGNGHLIAWFNGHDIMYKIINDEVHYADPTIIKNTITHATVTVFPNPAADVIHISGSEASSYSVADVTGRSVLAGSFDGSVKNVNIHSLAAGAYLLRLQGNESEMPVRFVKQ